MANDVRHFITTTETNKRFGIGITPQQYAGTWTLFVLSDRRYFAPSQWTYLRVEESPIQHKSMGIVSLTFQVIGLTHIHLVKVISSTSFLPMTFVHEIDINVAWLDCALSETVNAISRWFSRLLVGYEGRVIAHNIELLVLDVEFSSTGCATVAIVLSKTNTGRALLDQVFFVLRKATNRSSRS